MLIYLAGKRIDEALDPEGSAETGSGVNPSTYCVGEQLEERAAMSLSQ